MVLFFVSCLSWVYDIVFGVNFNLGFIYYVFFRLENFQDYICVVDLIGKYEILVEMNDCYGVIQVKIVYYFDLLGNCNEVFCDGYIYYLDMLLLIWIMDEFGYVVFLQFLYVLESFLGVYI